MWFDFNEDQATFATFLAQMLASKEGEFRNARDWGRFEWGEALDALLEENGFFDVASEETLGPVMAAEMIHEVARVPVAVETAASALLRPLVGADLPRPFAVSFAAIDGPIRFLPVARTLIHMESSSVRVAALEDGAVTEISSLFAYPMGAVKADTLDWHDVAADPQVAITLWRIGLAAEIAGNLKGGMDAVITHVSERHQFGRALGSFQGVQHRLATAAVQVDAARLLALRAAQSQDSAEALLALGYAQNIATRIGYDLHQFMGAMGLTLEHPLHRWTYRVRLLRSSLGGAGENLRGFASQRWGSE